MATFLQLAQRLRQECAGSGTGPAAVTGQTGELKRIVDWIATADEDIQRRHNAWKFMVGSFTLNTVADDNSYAAADCVVPVTNLRDWKKDSFKIYLLSAGVASETALDYIDYQSWYELYNTGPQTSQQPRHFSIGNDLSLKLGPAPNAVYRISGEYAKSVTTLSANADVPVYPGEYHLLAVYRAMMKYGRYTGATEVYQDGQNEYRRMLGQMEISQLPELLMAGPQT